MAVSTRTLQIQCTPTGENAIREKKPNVQSNSESFRAKSPLPICALGIITFSIISIIYSGVLKFDEDTDEQVWAAMTSVYPHVKVDCNVYRVDISQTWKYQPLNICVNHRAGTQKWSVMSVCDETQTNVITKEWDASDCMGEISKEYPDDDWVSNNFSVIICNKQSMIP